MLATFSLAAAFTATGKLLPTSWGVGTSLMWILPLLFVSLLLLIYRITEKDERIEQIISLPSREEFNRLTIDISSHQEFLRLKEFFHHTHHIYDHVTRVSYLSYFVSKLFSLDYVSSARGGLLHDFFLYDWRERKATDDRKASHGEQHPFIALANAKRYFDLNAKEEDIIVKHMFPKTLLAPSYAESVIVSLMDKVSTLWEYLTHFMKKGRAFFSES